MLLNPWKDQNLSITKGKEVEVSSKDEGFKGAWYRAILEEKPTKSGRKKLRVRYTTLLQDDFSTPLVETVAQSSIRPVPPDDPQNDVVFEEGSVVDADLKDGWWTGVVVKKMEDDDEKFLVYFDDPPDVIQFEKKQLRTHFDWIDSEWVQHENKEFSKSLFSSGTFVEVSSKIDKHEAVWVPALIVKEIEEDKKKFVVKCCNKSMSCNADEVKPNTIVDMCNVRPMPPPFSVEKYKLLDRVDAFRGTGWRQGLIRGILSEDRYTVSFVVTKEESVFKHSDLRPSKEWEDGVWHQGPKRNLEKETPFDTRLSEFTALCQPKKLRIIRSSTADKPITPKTTRKRTKTSPDRAESTETAIEGETEVPETATGLPLPQESQESGNKMADASMPIITPQAIPIAKESAPPVTPVINTRPVKEPEAEKTLEPIRMHNGLRNDSTRVKKSDEHYSKEYTRKRKREKKHNSNLKEAGEACNGANIRDDDYNQPLSTWILGGKSSAASDKSKLSADETGENGGTAMILPFVKKSPVWKAVESMGVFKTVKQSPHFIPLLEIREEFREGSAVGETVKFYSLLERVTNLQPDTPKSTLERLRECFTELEKYGFDITAPISRIEMLFPLEEKQVNRMEELKEKEREMAEEAMKKQKVEEDIREVKRKILELRSQEADLEEKKEGLDKDISEMRLCALALDKEIEDVELDFESIVAAPWSDISMIKP